MYLGTSVKEMEVNLNTILKAGTSLNKEILSEASNAFINEVKEKQEKILSLKIVNKDQLKAVVQL